MLASSTARRCRIWLGLAIPADDRANGGGALIPPRAKPPVHTETSGGVAARAALAPLLLLPPVTLAAQHVPQSGGAPA